MRAVVVQHTTVVVDGSGGRGARLSPVGDLQQFIVGVDLTHGTTPVGFGGTSAVVPTTENG